MAAIIIISVIAVVFALLLICPVGVRIAYNSFDESSPCVKLIIGFISITLMPKQKKKIKLSDYSPKKLRKERLAALKKERKKSEKAAKNKEEKKADSEPKKKTKKKRSIKSTVALLRYYLRCAGILIGKFGRSLKVKVDDFAIVMAGEDPASTAITYGYVSQLSAYFLDYISDNSNVRFSKKSVCTVNCDFTETQPTIFIDIKFTIRVIHILSLAISAVFMFLDKNKHN